MKCQSIKNKKAEPHTIIDSKPDIILGNESWLTPDIKNSESFRESFDAVRKDRASGAHGGVFIAFKSDLLCTETPEPDTNCEIVWCKINIIGCRTLYFGSFYRPLTRLTMITLRSLIHPYLGLCLTEMHMFWLEEILIAVIYSGVTCKYLWGFKKRQSQQQLLDIIGEHCLTQVVDIPTRNDKTLDLLFTNFPSPVNRVRGMPPIARLIMTLCT